MEPVTVQRGDSPVILGLPHTGTYVPPDIAANLNDRGRALSDTDWHVHDLYDGLLSGCTTVRATFHRYVIDANRDPTGVSLYPGQNTTGLIPITDFDGHAIWDGPPSPEETVDRLTQFHQPYHAALSAELARVKDLFGFVILYDCHSIRGDIPFLFDGLLPDFNIGTNEGTTCDAQIEARVLEICEATGGYRTALNGRFKGGWTTRHYGRPESGVHTIQMELAQRAYMTTEAPPWSYDAEKAARLRDPLAKILHSLDSWRP